MRQRRSTWGTGRRGRTPQEPNGAGLEEGVGSGQGSQRKMESHRSGYCSDTRGLAGLEWRVDSWQAQLSLITQGPLQKLKRRARQGFWKMNTGAVCQTGRKDRQQDHEGTVVVSFMAPARLGYRIQSTHWRCSEGILSLELMSTVT